MHPRVCVSAISTFKLALADDLAFWAAHGIDSVGVSVAKLEALRLGRGHRGASPTRSTRLARRQPHRARTVPCSPTRAVGAAARTPRARARDRPRARTPSAWCSRPDRPDRSRGTRPPTRSRPRSRPVLVEAHGARHPVRDRAHELAARRRRASCTRCTTSSTSRAGSTPACAWRSTRAGPSAGSRRRSPAAIDLIRLVQVSDFAVGTLATPDRLVPGDGDIPLARILGQVLDAGYAGVFDLELIGPKIDAEGYDVGGAARRRRARRAAHRRCSIGSSAPRTR